MFFAKFYSCADRAAKDSGSVRSRLCHLVAGAGLGLCALLAMSICTMAGTTGTWTPSASGGSVTTAGVTVTISGVTSTNLAPATDFFNTTNFWVNPYGGSVAGNPSLMVNPSPNGTTQTVILTFSKPVDNPVLHVDRLGGTAGTNSTTTVWTMSSFAATGGTVAMSRLGGDVEFIVSGNSFFRATSTSVTGTECTNTKNGSTCGSVQFVGTGITSITFTVTWADVNNPDKVIDEIIKIKNK